MGMGLEMRNVESGMVNGASRWGFAKETSKRASSQQANIPAKGNLRSTHTTYVLRTFCI